MGEAAEAAGANDMPTPARIDTEGRAANVPTAGVI